MLSNQDLGIVPRSSSFVIGFQFHNRSADIPHVGTMVNYNTEHCRPD
jgi:hypothetical protein